MWFVFALLSAFMSGCSVVFNKHLLRNVKAVTLSWSLFAFSIPFLVIFALSKGIPNFTFLFVLGVVGSSVFFVFSKTISLHIYKHTFLSQIYPLISFNTLFVYVLNVLFLSEHIKWTGLVGLIFIISGTYLLNIEQAKEGFLKPFSLLFKNKISLLFLFAVFLSSATTVFDKIATTQNSSETVLCIENILMSLLLTGYMIKNDKGWVNEVKNNFLPLVFASFIYMTLSLLVLYGYASGPVALVIGVKKLEMIYVLVLSHYLFKDKFTYVTFFATVLMLMGIVFIRI